MPRSYNITRADYAAQRRAVKMLKEDYRSIPDTVREDGGGRRG